MIREIKPANRPSAATKLAAIHPANAAVLHANVVEVCNGPARTEGVRRGQRRRDAQARCPDLVLLPANQRLAPMELDPREVTIYGKVVTVLRRI